MERLHTSIKAPEKEKNEVESTDIVVPEIKSDLNISKIIESLQPAIQVVTELEERINSIVQPIVNMVSEMQIKAKEIFDSIDFTELHEAAVILQENTSRFKIIMIEIGFPPHGSIPLSQISRIVSVYDENGIDYTKRMVNRYMTLFLFNEKEIKIMQKEWGNAVWLQKRIEILNSIVDGHFNGYYNLTIPTILAQIEGILVEGILTFDNTYKKIGYGEQKSFLAKVILGDTDRFSFDEEIEKIYTTIILARFERGEEIKSELSRHAILHGEDVIYGTKLNSLKTILLFDYIFLKLNELYVDAEK